MASLSSVDDNETPGFGNGMQISLDGLGAVIPVLHRGTPPRQADEEESVQQEKVSKNKVLLSEVRLRIFLYFFWFFSVFSSPLLPM